MDEIKSATCPPKCTPRESEKYFSHLSLRAHLSARSHKHSQEMVLKVGDADMDTLREQRAARLLAAEYYRLMSKHSLLCNESRILNNLLEAEARDYRGAWPYTDYHGTAR